MSFRGIHMFFKLLISAAVIGVSAMSASADVQRTEAQLSFRAELLEKISKENTKPSMNDLLTYEKKEVLSCHEEAMVIENMGRRDGASASKITYLVNTILAPTCDAGSTGKWTMVQRGHLSKEILRFDSAAASASSTVISVEFPSLVSCVRAAKDLNRVFGHPYSIKSACVSQETGSVLDIT